MSIIGGGIDLLLQPIIKAKLNKFREEHELESIKDGIAFEMFSNKMILCNHQPDAFNVENGLFDAVCVGGTNDMGIDGLCVKLNGILVTSLQDAQDVFELHRKAEIEFIFIQSKYKEGFDSGEYSKFINGVEDFLSDKHFQPHNEKIDAQLKIKEYLFSDNVMIRWTMNPTVRLYYVVMGDWNDSPHIIAITQKFEEHIKVLNSYGEILVKYVDANAFKRVCDDNDNLFSTTLNIIDLFSLTQVEKVDNSMVALVGASELLSLIKTEDGLIRKNLFEDNVRDFQGDTTINNEILSTISDDPESFVLLNNGITIVCQEVLPGNRKITIKNPQIVNGCQTCSVIFVADKLGHEISDVVITAKIIATNSDNITNNIVKGTNRQNIVYDEAFEITREFHKELEQFFMAMSNSNTKLFYERRSRQYFDNPTITSLQKVNLRVLIQSFVSLFLNQPHKGHRHPAKLLQDFKNKIFIDTQSKYPYFVSCKLHQFFEISINKSRIPKHLRTYKMHIIWIFQNIAEGTPPNINNEKKIDGYCTRILSLLEDEHRANDLLQEAISSFVKIKNEWISEKGESFKHGIKDSAEFTQYMKNSLALKRSEPLIEESPLQFRGKVIKIGLDKHNRFFGFVSKYPDNIFFHENDNPGLDYRELMGLDVLYIPKIDDVTKNEKAIGVCLVNTIS